MRKNSQNSWASVWTPDLLSPSHIFNKNGMNDKCKPSCFDNSWANESKSLSINAGTDEVLNNQGIYYCHSKSFLCMVFLNVTEFFLRKLACQIWFKQEIGRTSWQKNHRKLMVNLWYNLDSNQIVVRREDKTSSLALRDRGRLGIRTMFALASKSSSAIM